MPMRDFHLIDVMDGADWGRVTWGMAPDEIEYRVIVDDRSHQQSDSLTRLFALYQHARTESPTTENDALPPFRLTEMATGIALRARTRDVPFETTYDDLREALEVFLSEVFRRLDEESTPERRAEGLAFVSEELEIDATAIYRELVA